MAIAFAFALPAQAEVLSGRVVSVIDGDTIIVLDAGKRQHKVRLSAADAPERGQPWGSRSRQVLTALACSVSEGCTSSAWR